MQCMENMILLWRVNKKDLRTALIKNLVAPAKNSLWLIILPGAIPPFVSVSTILISVNRLFFTSGQFCSDYSFGLQNQHL
jgi:hypothetical protein